MRFSFVSLLFYMMLLVILGVNIYAVFTFNDLYNTKVTLIGDCIIIITLGSMVLLSKPKKKTGVEKIHLIRKVGNQ